MHLHRQILVLSFSICRHSLPRLCQIEPLQSDLHQSNSPPNKSLNIPKGVLEVLGRSAVDVEGGHVVGVVCVRHVLQAGHIAETAELATGEGLGFGEKGIVGFAPFQRFEKLTFRLGEVVRIGTEEFLEYYEGWVWRLFAFAQVSLKPSNILKSIEVLVA